ncbi:MAG: outer membrane beta-barrel protein [Saprospiraceae bacterium]|nr:outer membrane beta-barrel protein [Saprospiraceae bacterium]
MYKKLIYLFYFHCFTASLSQAQELTPKKITSGFTIGGNFNRMTAVKLTNINFFNFSPFINERTWKVQYQSGLFIGGFLRRRLGDLLSLQAEFNLVWSRQKAQLEDIVIPNPNINNNGGVLFNFQTVQGVGGTVNFNNVYWQLPLMVNFTMDKATLFEAGLFFNGTLLNNSTQNLVTTTFSELSLSTGTVVNFNPPRVVNNTAAPAMKAGVGWLLGLNYSLNDRFFVRLRYEGGLTPVSDFSDLRENRMTVGMGFNMR